MAWTMDESRPIYLQLMEQIEQNIISGIYQPGQRLPSVRDLALEAAVNPNTMQKALSELERTGLLYTQRTSGRFITDDQTLLHDTKKRLASSHMDRYLENMNAIGFKKEQAASLLHEYVENISGGPLN